MDDTLDFVTVRCDGSGWRPGLHNGDVGGCVKCGRLISLVDNGQINLSDGLPALMLADHERRERIGGQFS
jgi:hypothetical protein